jgi:hypothetical protein
VILFSFQAKLVKIVKRNRTEFFSQIKKITASEDEMNHKTCPKVKEHIQRAAAAHTGEYCGCRPGAFLPRVGPPNPTILN